MIEVIPAIDLMGGRCVRLQQGGFESQKAYPIDPIELATGFREAGCKRLHIVDLEGAQKGYPVHLKLISEIAKKTGMIIQSGGGIKTKDHFYDAINSGISKLILGSMAVKNPMLFMDLLESSGPESIILAADVLQGKVMVSGWVNSSEYSIRDLVNQFKDKGLTSVLVTDIQRDGMLSGPATELYFQLQQDFPLMEIIASGGVSNITDVENLDQAGVKSVVIGKALFEGYITMAQLKKFF